jgi:hypothetical protein
VFGEVLASYRKCAAVSVSKIAMFSARNDEDSQQSEYRSMIGDD